MFWPAPQAATLVLGDDGAGHGAPLLHVGLSEQAEQDRRRLVGDRQSLHTQLSLGLQRLQSCAFLAQIRIDQVTDAGLQRILQLAHELQVGAEGVGAGAQAAQSSRDWNEPSVRYKEYGFRVARTL